MVAFNWLGFAVWILNLILFFALKQMKYVGNYRSASISGWFSGIVGLLILYHAKVPFFSQLTVENILIFSLVVFFALIFIFLPIFAPQINFSPIKHIPRFFGHLGLLLGVIFGFLVGVLV